MAWKLVSPSMGPLPHPTEGGAHWELEKPCTERHSDSMSKDALNICTMVLSAWGRDNRYGAPPSDAWWWGINITLPPPPPWPLAGVEGNNRMQLRLPV